MARAEGLEPPTLVPVLETGALAAELRACGRRDRDRTDGLLCFRQALYAFLSYSPKVDLAGLEPTASALCLHAVLSRTELQAQSPAAIAGRRVFNYARTGVNSSERPTRTPFIQTNSISPARKKKKGPHRGPADRVERIQSVSQELHRCEHRRSQRPTAACWAWGDEGAGPLWLR